MRSIFKTSCRAVFSKLVMLLSSSVSAIFFAQSMRNLKACTVTGHGDNLHASASEYLRSTYSFSVRDFFSRFFNCVTVFAAKCHEEIASIISNIDPIADTALVIDR
jgi:hypothetical protein